MGFCVKLDWHEGLVKQLKLDWHEELVKQLEGSVWLQHQGKLMLFLQERGEIQ